MLIQSAFYVRPITILIFIAVMEMGCCYAQSNRANPTDISLVNNNGSPCGYILFSDDFSDGNADGWTPYFDGTWSVNNYQYVVNIGGGVNLRGISLAANTAWMDYIFDVDLKAEEGASKIILFRYIDENNYYSVGIIGLELYDYYKVNLVKVENGVGTVVVNNDYPHDNSAWHHAKTIVKGNHIVAYVDGDLVIDYTDSGSSITHGQIGLQGFTGSIGENNKVRFDNVMIWQPCTLSLPVIIRQ
jgi:hypothetical protein